MKTFFKRVWADRFAFRRLSSKTLAAIERKEIELKELIEQNNDGIKRVFNSYKYTESVLNKLKNDPVISGIQTQTPKQ